MADAHPSQRYRAALAAIDAANAQDPTTVVLRGRTGPKELLHARLMTERVMELDPDADELRLLAARASHLRRWALPRSEYPAGRAGYLRWRAEARRRHAADVVDLLVAHGYSDDEVARVAAIVGKVGLGSDVAVQVHEDALCLVFLEAQLADVGSQLGEEHTVDVLVRTLAKMSDAGRAAAGTVDLPAPARALLEQALARWSARDGAALGRGDGPSPGPPVP